MIVNFCATWCGPCRLEMPALEALQAAHQEDFEVIFLSDEPADFLRSYTDGRNLTGTYGRFVPNEMGEPYSMARLRRPMTYLIDRNGDLREIIQEAKNYAFFERAFVDDR